MIGLILVGFSFFFSFFVLFFMVKRYISRKEQAILCLFKAYFEPQGEGQPSEFSLLTDQIALQFSRHILAGFKTTAMGMVSGEAKQHAAVQGAITQDVISLQNPLIGAALSQFPALRKLLDKNPQLAPLAANFLKGGNNRDNNETGVGMGQHPYNNLY